MGDIRQRGGILEHQVATRGEPEQWVRVAYDAAGSPLPVILQGETAAVWLEEETGRVVFSVGSNLLSAPAVVLGAVHDALRDAVLQGKGIAVKAGLEAIERSERERHDQTMAQLQAEIDRKRAELAGLEAAAGAAQTEAQDAAPPV